MDSNKQYIELTGSNKQYLEVVENAFQNNELAKYGHLMMQYQCAMLEVKTKLDVLNTELSYQTSRNPFESIKCRIKSPKSIIDKLKRNNYPLTVDSIEANLNDVAGIRVICSFPDDIYKLVDCLLAQDDITLIEKKDYITNPKKSGYRSYHLIIEVPIFLTTEKKPMRVEVQFRTIAMDFWATDMIFPYLSKIMHLLLVVPWSSAIIYLVKFCVFVIFLYSFPYLLHSSVKLAD